MYLLDPELLADPAGGYGRVREQGPVVRAWLTDEQPVWLVTRYDDVRDGLRDPRFVNSPAAIPGFTGPDPRRPLVDMLNLPAEVLDYFMISALDIDPPDHTRMRGAVARSFTGRRMQALRPRIEQVVEELLAALPAHAENGAADLVERFAYPLATTVVCELVGIPEAVRPLFRQWGDDIVTMDPDRLGTSSPALIEAVHDLLRQRRERPADDMLTALAEATGSGRYPISEKEAVTMTLNVVMAGYENAAQLIINAVAALVTHPEQLELLRTDRALLPGAVEEFIRWCGPDIMVRMRIAAEDTELHGTPIRQGDAVQFILVSANHDPRRYPDAHRLDLTRRQADQSEGHLGFGGGIHYCLGASISRLECETALRGLLDRYPGLAMAVAPEDLPRIAIPGAAPRYTGLPLLV
ncbi:cytochrome [Streptomyces sp. CBMA156]|nr:cytochrome P450 [Streptomyces sp. CBMA156]MBD0671457.1 cytochrome [Streptomyces sp. CBMA156]